MTITGKDLIEWGYAPGKWFPAAIAEANRLRADGAEDAAVKAAVAALSPPEPIALLAEGETPYHRNIEAETPAETRTIEAVDETMRALLRTPTLTAGAAMPDACPAGGVGTIPVGGVAAAKGAIHPGMHSADICCSVAVSVLGSVDPTAVLDAAHAVTHFGGGGRSAEAQVPPPAAVMAPFESNPFLKGLEGFATAHFATQGDGNHFLFVGRIRSTGQTAIVTHHGSRKPGAELYKRGMAAAEKLRRRRAPEVLKQNAWIDADSAEGEAYWDALQAIRAWTKANHFAIHDLAIERLGLDAPSVTDRFWNEHNFVFRRGDLFYHGKGATPAWADFAEDSSGLVLIPLNMVEPVLVARGTDAVSGLGFCPHGAGRNVSRSEHMRRVAGRSEAAVLKEETKGVDARFFSGHPDLAELPSAYKNAETVRRQIDQFGLAEVVDQIDPLGSIMAGDWRRSFAKKSKERGKTLRDKRRGR